MQEFQLRCFVRGREDKWEGFCIDLDIAVQGVSLEDVRSRLDEAIHTYVEDLRQESPQDAYRLLKRRAPVWLRARIIGSFMLHLVLGGRRGDELNAEFRIPCHA